MKTKFFTFCILLTSVLVLSFEKASAQQWLTAGNNLVGGEMLGSLNSQPLNIVTNNTSRIYVTPPGRGGIGTQTPAKFLTVKGAGSAPAASWVNAGAPLFVGFGETTIGNSDFIL